jgi:hypothetical protein
MIATLRDQRRLEWQLLGPRFASSGRLDERGPGMIEKDFARGGQLDPPRAADQQLGAGLAPEIPDLPSK